MSNHIENGANLYSQEELKGLNVKLMDPRSTFGYDTGRKILRFAIGEGLIDSSQVKRVLDFGAGEGGSTLAIQGYFPEAIVDAAEKSKGRAVNFKRAGDLLPGNLFADGILRLGEVKEEPLEKYDLVVGSMFGPLGPRFGSLTTLDFGEFLAATQGAVNPEGHVLIYSDSATVESVGDYLAEKAIPFIKTQSDVFSMYGMHDIICIPATSPES